MQKCLRSETIESYGLCVLLKFEKLKEIALNMSIFSKRNYYSCIIIFFKKSSNTRYCENY